jgi:hypothetical protein
MRIVYSVMRITRNAHRDLFRNAYRLFVMRIVVYFLMRIVVYSVMRITRNARHLFRNAPGNAHYFRRYI